MNTLIKKPAIFFVLFISLVTFLSSCSKHGTFTTITPPGGSSDTSWLNQPTSQPNIIIILSDDIGYEVPTIDGGESYSTPNIDMMAKQGMLFTQCHATPLCSPSRTMLLTGKYNYRNYTEWSFMDLSQRTFANMLQDAGYDTYALGKWQFGSGDFGVHTFGFKKYCIFDPYVDTLDADVYRYKNPLLLTNGSYMPYAKTFGKYCDDILVDSLGAYARQSMANQKPFCIYYAMSIGHTPFSPTPDDPEFAGWDPLLHISDPKFFPSMINYMDKKVGAVIDTIASLGISKNTIIIFSGDNGTPQQIYSLFNGQLIRGGKAKTIETGTHVPLIVYMPGSVLPGRVNNDLISYTDFLPTLADIAKIPVPVTNGQIDGVSFYPQILGDEGNPRKWIYWWYKPDRFIRTSDTSLNVYYRWVQNTQYKLYDSTGFFYDFIQDPNELNPIPYNNLTPDEISLKNSYQQILDNMGY